MVCANPECRHESSYLRSGSLYWVDEHPVSGKSERRRFIWLCSDCARKFRVETWRPPGSQLRPVDSGEEVRSKHPRSVPAEGAIREPALRASGRH